MNPGFEVDLGETPLATHSRHSQLWELWSSWYHVGRQLSGDRDVGRVQEGPPSLKVLANRDFKGEEITGIMGIEAQAVKEAVFGATSQGICISSVMLVGCTHSSKIKVL
ncbi:uncharacterized protein [Palaemon carinicauda]|uniref:uncharacterized protein n=1 Tax=Palaemon carinicauda TaxID=392227 RepID=UPI0035B5B0CC